MDLRMLLLAVAALIVSLLFAAVHAEEPRTIYAQSFDSLAHDRGAITSLGVSIRSIRYFGKQNPNEDLPDDPRQLTSQQRSDIRKGEFFDRQRIPEIAAIPGLMDRVPQLAEQLFDASVFHGPKIAGALLQRSLDTVLGTDLRTMRMGRKFYDGIVGPKTLAVIRDAARQNKLRDVNNEMVARREVSEFRNNPGWYKRTRKFLIP